MKVCILGVLTVNLLTFCSQNAPLSHQNSPLTDARFQKDG